MKGMFKTDKVKSIIIDRYDYYGGDYILNKIDSLNLTNESSIVYVKNFMLENEEGLTFYIFNANKFYKIVALDQEDNRDKLICEVFNKKDIKNIKFISDSHNNVTLSFKIENIQETFNIKDVHFNYKVTCNSAIKDLIEYLVL